MSNPTGKIFIKPTKEAIQVRNPERGGHLKNEGEWVPKNAYWHRRLNDGDVVNAKPPATKKIIKE